MTLLCVLLGSPLLAQVRDPEDTLSAGEGSGPLSEISRPVGEGLAVHDGALTIGETSGGPVRSGPVRDARTRSMLSGPVSEVSVGSMTHFRGLTGGGSIAENSAGAVKHDVAAPLGERISRPLRELGPLQDHLRARRLDPAADVVIDETVAEVDGPLEFVEEPAGDAVPPDDAELPTYDASELAEVAESLELEPSDSDPDRLTDR
jgi:hypothetical protein